MKLQGPEALVTIIALSVRASVLSVCPRPQHFFLYIHEDKFIFEIPENRRFSFSGTRNSVHFPFNRIKFISLYEIHNSYFSMRKIALLIVVSDFVCPWHSFLLIHEDKFILMNCSSSRFDSKSRLQIMPTNHIIQFIVLHDVFDRNQMNEE